MSPERIRVREEFAGYPSYKLYDAGTNTYPSSWICCQGFLSTVPEVLVFDELHTIAADKALMLPLWFGKIKAQTTNPVICIGTSATMISGGTIQQQKDKVAEVAAKMFGSNFSIDQIVMETLVPCFFQRKPLPHPKKIFKRQFITKIDIYSSESTLLVFPYLIWIEIVLP